MSQLTIELAEKQSFLMCKIVKPVILIQILICEGNLLWNFH